ncbi:MAG: YwaF family protein [Planctomycetota bacterium]|jgi:hypothetical integral membrane protein (TIGR02206 family)
MTAAVLQSEFIQFGPPHLIVIATLIVLCVTVSAVVRYAPSSTVKHGICRGLVVVLLGGECFKYVFTYTQYGRDYFVQSSLPLHVCGIAVYLAAFMLITRRQVVFEIVYFWALGGTTQAILTPAVAAGFPSYHFYQFFIEHSAVIIAVFVAVFGLKMRPRLKGVWITYALSWLLVFVVGGINYLLDTNYMYLCRPPTGVSPFYFLDWPWYILFQSGLALVIFSLLYLPFARQPKLAVN